MSGLVEATSGTSHNKTIRSFNGPTCNQNKIEHVAWCLSALHTVYQFLNAVYCPLTGTFISCSCSDLFCGCKPDLLTWMISWLWSSCESINIFSSSRCSRVFQPMFYWRQKTLFWLVFLQGVHGRYTAQFYAMTRSICTQTASAWKC
jgi:hypothetical protein